MLSYNMALSNAHLRPDIVAEFDGGNADIAAGQRNDYEYLCRVGTDDPTEALTWLHIESYFSSDARTGDRETLFYRRGPIHTGIVKSRDPQLRPIMYDNVRLWRSYLGFEPKMRHTVDLNLGHGGDYLYLCF